MITNLTEEEMRRALFGSSHADTPASVPPARQEPARIVMLSQQTVAKRIVPKPVTPRLLVTLRVGNEFEGKTELFIHEADMLSTLQAELDATKAARRKFKYVEVVSVKPAK